MEQQADRHTRSRQGPQAAKHKHSEQAHPLQPATDAEPHRPSSLCFSTDTTRATRRSHREMAVEPLLSAGLDRAHDVSAVVNTKSGSATCCEEKTSRTRRQRNHASGRSGRCRCRAHCSCETADNSSKRRKHSSENRTGRQKHNRQNPECTSLGSGAGATSLGSSLCETEERELSVKQPASQPSVTRRNIQRTTRGRSQSSAGYGLRMLVPAWQPP